MWANDGVTMLTVFFSASGMSDLDNEQMTDSILSEGFVTFHEGAKRYIDKMLRGDPAGNMMWSVSIVVGDEDQTFVASSLPIFPHPSTSKHSSIFNSELLAINSRASAESS